jgi:hypothetical protein
VKNNNPEMKASLNQTRTDSQSGADILEGEGSNANVPSNQFGPFSALNDRIKKKNFEIDF